MGSVNKLTKDSTGLDLGLESGEGPGVILRYMEKGFNSDISCLGTQYHVQTEDWGSENPYLVSRVFHNGAVVKSIKTSYEEVLPRGPVAEARTIRLAMKIQHHQILDLLVSGKLL